mgnify:CR=1 FL=1|tara:strand:- start:4590 stop:7328 length:2739 start_codon:yes stop_codon:yes gene_type:complete
MADKSEIASLQLFFPLSDGGLNRQQFLTDVLMPQIPRGTNKTTRSALAKIIYDKSFPSNVSKGLTSEQHKKILASRPQGREKILSFNSNFHQEFEESYGAIKEPSLLEQQEYNRYISFMTNIGTSQLAVLQPYVRLIYRYRKNNKGDWKELTMPFPSFTTEQEFGGVLSSNFARGDGSGIENITVDRKFPQLGNILHVTADINFFFQNLGVLTREMKFPRKNFPSPFTFLKVMALIPPETEQLVLEYGYSLNNKFTDPTIIPPSIQQQILQKEKKRFILRYMKHTFNIQQDGSVKLSVSYTTQQDTDLLDKRKDIALPRDKLKIAALSPEGGEKTTQLLRLYESKYKKKDDLEQSLRTIKTQTEKRKGAARVRGKSQKSTEILKLQKRKNKILQEIKDLNVELNTLKERLTPLAKPLFVNDMINHMEVFKLSFAGKSIDPSGDGQRDFGMFAYLSLVAKEGGELVDIELGKMSTSFSTESFKDNLTLDLLDGKDKNKKITLIDNLAGTIFNLPKGVYKQGKNKKFGDMIFFSIRSLLAAAYRQLPAKERETAPYISLGNIDASSLGMEYTVNIGDVLVELNFFQRWYYESYTKKGRLVYSFGDFVNDVMKQLIPQILEENPVSLFGKRRLGTIERTNYLTLLKSDKETTKLFDSLYFNNKKDDLRKIASHVKRTSDTKTSKDLLSFVHYSLMRNPSAPVGSAYLKRNLADTNFREDNDISFGVPHIKIGADRGLLKNISFSASDFPYLRTALWAENLTDSAETLLRYKYSAAVQTIGNNIFFKGGFFAIPPNLLGIENESFDPGISGYYVIQGVTDTLSLGNYQTSLNGTWVYNPRLNNGKDGSDVNQQEEADDIPPTKLNITIPLYLENLLRLDAKILIKNGINPDFSMSKKQEDNLAKQRDELKDYKENF